MNRIENSVRACSERRAKIGPITNPTNRSIPVYSPLPATWKKLIAQSWLLAIATTNPTMTTATIGSPATGTI